MKKKTHRTLALLPVLLPALLQGAGAAPTQAQAQAQAQVKAALPVDSGPGQAPRFGEARSTWKQITQQTLELDQMIAGGGLGKVHDAALSLRDSVREMRFAWQELSPPQKATADATIKKLDGLMDNLHEAADHNNRKATVLEQRRLHLLLDELTGSFPPGVLAPVGPILTRGSAQDPVCRMTVDPATAAARVASGGQMYYFCAASEAEQFRKNPAPWIRLHDEITFGKPRAYAVSLHSNGAIAPGKETNLVFAIREKGKAQLTTRFQMVHERLFHLIAVSDDLTWFGHVHPAQGKDGRFYLRQTFPRDGRYWLYSDFTPADGANTVVRSELRVGTGKAGFRVQPAVDATLQKRVDGVDVKLGLSSPLRAGKQSLLTYTLSRNGRPVRDMRPYLAAMGHLMAISSDGERVVHTHSASPGLDSHTGLEVTPDMASASGPVQTFKLEVPAGGIYKIWAQFGVGNQIITVPFTLRANPKLTMKNSNFNPLVATGLAAALATAPASAKPAAGKTSPVQQVTITLPQGYKTNVATVRAGRPLALTFHLKQDAGCGNSISVPAAKWSRTLQVGQKATVQYTPKKSGSLKFSCSMGHMHGNLLVK